ncbi:hypothetical protein FKM82_021845 [Ascaphus truei]
MQSPTETDLTEVGQLIRGLAQCIDTLGNQITSLVMQLSQLSLQPIPAPAAQGGDRPSELRIPTPKAYAGDPLACRGFLNQCEIQFEISPSLFPTGRTKVAYVYSLLTGDALAWASPIWELRAETTQDYQLFRQEFQQVFDIPARRDTAAASLVQLSQGRRSVAKYALEFRTVAAETHWNHEALIAVFWQGLSDSIKDELAVQPRPQGLEELIAICIRVDQRLQQRRHERQRPRIFSSDPILPRSFPAIHPVLDTVEPMQIASQEFRNTDRTADRTHDRTAERARRRNEGLCYYCGSPEHTVRFCPLRPKEQTRPMGQEGLILGSISSHAISEEELPKRIMLPVSLKGPNFRVTTAAFLDSGSGGNFVDQDFATLNKIPLIAKKSPIGLEAIDGRPLQPAFITLETLPLTLSAGTHTEIISFDHNPRIDWRDGKTIQWEPESDASPLPVISPTTVLAGVETPPANVSALPEAYADFIDVFSKTQSEVLPPHRPYDCPINLVPGAVLPKCKSYPLSLPETEAMAAYIKENLEKGFIRNSSSPAGAGFFFSRIDTPFR